MAALTEKRAHFIRQLMQDDMSSGKHLSIVTRFPPEPNGYLHIGHAKSICLNFGLAEEFAGKCYLRFDDTNPTCEEEAFVQSIIEDVKWLGFTFCEITYASDYYQQLYDFAILLIQQGKAYVDDLSLEEMRTYRGTLQTPGKDSPYRTRSVAENLDLFLRMRAGEFPEGARVLRARIDMQSGNINLRDPVLYRIRHVAHLRTGNTWCIYPMYDYAHPISDALEGITHSLCTLEFQDHRPFYEWVLQQLPLTAKPVQTEFARLNVSHTVTSKRKLRELVDNQDVTGWDDPRMPTLSGMRRRGYPPAAIRQFCEEVGISRSDSLIDAAVLENCVRDELNRTAMRGMCVLDPVRVIIDNYPVGQVEQLSVAWSPQDAASRVIPFARELWIDISDFMAEPIKGYHRLAPGKEVRLRHAYVIRCNEIVRNASNDIIEIHCTYDPSTLGKNPVDRKVKGVIHWVAVDFAHPIVVHQYDRLLNTSNPTDHTSLNPNSLVSMDAWCEPALATLADNTVVQFERVGYYCVHERNNLHVKSFHRVVALKDTWGATC